MTHVFERSAGGDWAETATLEYNSGDNTGNWFLGQELAIDRGQLAIGYGPYSNSPSSMPLQFAKRSDGDWPITLGHSNWQGHPRDPERPPSYQSDHLAGRSVAISGSLAAATDRFFSNTGELGLARLWRQQADGAWVESEYLAVPDVSVCPYLCTPISVGLDDQFAVASARSSSGAGRLPVMHGVHFFERQPTGDWLSTETFMAPEDSGTFAIVEIDGDVAVSRDLNSSVVQTYERRAGKWEEGFSVQPTSSTTSGEPSMFGVAVERDQLAFSAGTGVAEDPYRVEVYRRTGFGQWSLLTTIHDPEPSMNNHFGASLDFDQGRLLIGTQSLSVSRDGGRFNLSPGSAYLFVPVPEPSAGAFTALLILWFMPSTTGRHRQSADISR